MNNRTLLINKLLISLSLFLIGSSYLLGSNTNSISTLLAFYQLTFLSSKTVAFQVGIYFLLISTSCFYSISNKKFEKVTAYGLIILAIVPLLTLLWSGRYYAEYGGFPVIGSGQGIIKYFALIPFIILLLNNNVSDKKLNIYSYISILIVLIWIGGMKFTTVEAEGIVKLVKNSPLMSWMYYVWDVQTSSNLIGVYDILFVLALGISLLFRNKMLFIISWLACFSIFVVTQTFLFTTPAALSSSTLLGPTGQFVVKDLWYIVNMLTIFAINKDLLKENK
ncbi:hypothetical protein C5F61_05205 [Photobacterium damselae subsp. damselae]|uniref:DUF417 family protein n=3 Tax=Photobacterium damselae TaxID=38293 RepID=UPI000D06F341|nr:DUF417 family protein [Photobacterium damselae]PSB79690.1 hypothetical protein C5F61_05205 [Photobacterium damselae subsp. damselae]UKA04301.1 YkgB family protein [Photobacterium damselae subsp. damselae]